MTARSLSLLLILYSGFAYAVVTNNYYYSTTSAASSACLSMFPGSGTCTAFNNEVITQCGTGSPNAKFVTNSHIVNGVSTSEKWHGCISSTSCPAGQTLAVDGSCVYPCPASGTKQEIAVKTGTADNPNLFTIDLFDQSTAIYHGAEFTFYPENYVPGGSYLKDDGSIMTKYNATATGSCPTGSTDTVSTPETGKPSVNTSNQGKCATDAKGNTTCKDSPSGNLKCGTVNGAQVCFDTTPGVGTVNGQPFQTSDKNCGMVNGKPVCVSSDPTKPSTQGCLVNGGVKNCINSDVVTTTDKTVTANPDGSTTTTTTTDNNIIGHSPVTTTTTTNPDGSESTVTTDPNTGSGTGTGGTGTGQTDCDKYPDAVGCKTVDQLVGSTPAAESLDDGTGSIVPGTFSYTAWTGSGGTCPTPVTVKGATWDYSTFCDRAPILKTVLLAFAAVVSTLIILGA